MIYNDIDDDDVDSNDEHENVVGNKQLIHL